MKFEKKINTRQREILKKLTPFTGTEISDIENHIDENLQEISRMSIFRDLQELIELKYVIREGKGKASTYKLSPQYNLVRLIDSEKYFQTPPDQREIYKKFNYEIFKNFKDIFSEVEQIKLKELTKEFREQYKYLSDTVLKKEFERLTIELSWKSSRIEGNTYSLLDTEFLIKEGREARGKTKEEAVMILNHKNTLDYIRTNIKKYKKISKHAIIEIHTLLTKGLQIKSNFRDSLVGIGGTAFRPIDNHFQIEEAVEELCDLINNASNIFEKAVLALLMISYIQPFEDGNKRTSRMLNNAILLAGNACPLSLRSIDEKEYKEALLMFYETNNLSKFKEIFIEQYEFAVNNYFRKHSS
jgi:Fic family protein